MRKNRSFVSFVSIERVPPCSYRAVTFRAATPASDDCSKMISIVPSAGRILRKSSRFINSCPLAAGMSGDTRLRLVLVSPCWIIFGRIVYGMVHPCSRNLLAEICLDLQLIISRFTKRNAFSLSLHVDGERNGDAAGRRESLRRSVNVVRGIGLQSLRECFGGDAVQSLERDPETIVSDYERSAADRF